jgi:hypothetical protein
VPLPCSIGVNADQLRAAWLTLLAAWLILIAVRLLVDIAIRALSPAVNDPTTAVQALDQIEDLLHRLSRRQLDAAEVHDATGVLRLTFLVPTWEDYLDLSFDKSVSTARLQSRSFDACGWFWWGSQRL